MTRNILIATIVSLSSSAWAVEEAIPAAGTSAEAQQSQISRTNQLTIGYAVGGDTLIEREDQSTLDAGDGFFITVGQLYTTQNPRFNLQWDIGIKFESLPASNGSASIQRFPLTGLAFYSFDTLRLGAGPTLHLFPEFEVDIAGYNERNKFDPAIGLALQIDYTVNQTFVGIRFENINYHGANVTPGLAGSVESNSIGFLFGSAF